MNGIIHIMTKEEFKNKLKTYKTMDWLKNCKIRMMKGSFYNGMKLTTDIEVINGEPYVNGVKRSWDDVTERKDYKQRIVNHSFSHIKNMIINNGKITVDGMSLEEWYNRDDVVVINITVNGDVESINADSCDTISINGNANYVNTKNGNVSVSGNIEGNAESKNGNKVGNFRRINFSNIFFN